jgi:hypothetical protein
MRSVLAIIPEMERGEGRIEKEAVGILTIGRV